MVLRIGWVGFHAEGLLAFDALFGQERVVIPGVVTLASEKRAKRSGMIDYQPLCARHRIPVHEITNINNAASVELLRSFEVDLLCVIGWGQILRREALSVARIGVVGAHASLLPHNRGSAPVNWAIIRGECGTGNTLMWLSEEVDGGRIIDQVPITITPYDTCATIYNQVALTNRDMLLRLVGALLNGERPGRPQPWTTEALLPRRRPEDGVIDWSERESSVYDFVRALSRPYPGAFSWIDGQKWTIWNAASLPATARYGRMPGEVLGGVMSPSAAACGQLVATGRGAVIILEMESEDGQIVSGRDLCDERWIGRRWSNA